MCIKLLTVGQNVTELLFVRLDNLYLFRTDQKLISSIGKRVSPKKPKRGKTRPFFPQGSNQTSAMERFAQKNLIKFGAGLKYIGQEMTEKFVEQTDIH